MLQHATPTAQSLQAELAARVNASTLALDLAQQSIEADIRSAFKVGMAGGTPRVPFSMVFFDSDFPGGFTYVARMRPFAEAFDDAMDRAPVRDALLAAMREQRGAVALTLLARFERLAVDLYVAEHAPRLAAAITAGEC